MIRPATKEDVAAILEVRFSVRENVITPSRLQELGINEESLAEGLEKDYSGYCAEQDGRIVGFSMADRSVGSIFALFVRPEVEGQGLGTRLLAAAMRDLWASGHARIILSTEPQTRAFQFYVRHGWRHVGYTSDGEAKLEYLNPDQGQ